MNTDRHTGSIKRAQIEAVDAVLEAFMRNTECKQSDWDAVGQDGDSFPHAYGVDLRQVDLSPEVGLPLGSIVFPMAEVAEERKEQLMPTPFGTVRVWDRAGRPAAAANPRGTAGGPSRVSRGHLLSGGYGERDSAAAEAGTLCSDGDRGRAADLLCVRCRLRLILSGADN
jgi:hypothetical protein